MTKTLLVFADRKRSPLRCVWRATGNPAQPLACTWVGRESHGSRQPLPARTHVCALCA